LAKRLTLLTPLAYFHARLRNTFYRRRVGFLCFGLALVISACILLWPTSQRTQAAGSPHILPSDHLVVLNEPDPTTAIVEPAPAPIPTEIPAPTSTPFLIPETGLVWDRNAPGAYLWESPEGNILAHLPNGTKVRYLEGRSSYGNQPWTQVTTSAGEGWILDTQVYREAEDPVAYVVLQEGTYLRDQPGSGILQTLPMGTPIMGILEIQDVEGRNWALVEVVNGADGWVVEAWLSAEMPLGEPHD
jgi:hypothetical protein